MLARKRFLLGGGGALMPVFVSILAVDVGAQLMAGDGYTLAEVLGTAIRYTVLFIIGGLVAYLHVDEEKPFKLFELGIAAPALITSLVTANGIVDTRVSEQDLQNAQTHFEISLISSAYASEDSIQNSPQPVNNTSKSKFQEFIDGLTGKVYQRKASKTASETVSDRPQNSSQSQASTNDSQTSQ